MTHALVAFLFVSPAHNFVVAVANNVQVGISTSVAFFGNAVAVVAQNFHG